MERELTKEQKLAIKALKKAVKRVNDADLVILMHDGSVTIHYKADHEEYGPFDHGCYGMSCEDGSPVEAIDVFQGIEH